MYTYEFVFWMIPIKWFLTVPFPSPAFLASGSSSARQPSSLLRPSFSSPEVKVIRGFHIFSHNVVNNIWPIDLTAGKICSNPGFSMFGCTQLGHGKLRNHSVCITPLFKHIGPLLALVHVPLHHLSWLSLLCGITMLSWYEFRITFQYGKDTFDLYWWCT